MAIRINSFAIERHDMSTRMPFKYGIATMTHLPHVFIRVDAEFGGRAQRGISADHLPPKWFTKDPDRDPNDEIDDMLDVIERAGRKAESIESDSVFNFWLQLYKLQDDWRANAGVPPLLAHFGTSLIERALIDAFCRHQNQSFKQLLQSDKFGIDWSGMRPELAGLQPRDLFPEASLAQVTARHTVGMADPLRDSEIPDSDRLEDGLPQSLEACIRYYGVRHFKIKINGLLDQDIPRLASIAGLFGDLNLAEYAFTLDGNEQFQTVEALRDFWGTLNGEENMGGLFEHLLFIEQPFHRDVALASEIGEGLRAWSEAPPIIIDESDATLESLPAALNLGYRGTSHKNCKGVFKGIMNRAAIAVRNREAGEPRFLMSGEDLANIGPVANHQDLAVQAALGISSVERNGHHYFQGLSMFRDSIQDNALKRFPELYTNRDTGFVRLNIEKGIIDTQRLSDTLFGVDSSLL